MAYLPASLVLVDYGEVPQVIHSRLLLAHVQNDDFFIASPDLDIYCETLNTANPDYVGFYPALPGGGVPAAVVGLNVYSFRALGAADYAALLDAGRVEAENERLRRGLAAVAPGGMPFVGAVAAGAPAAEVWVLAEPIEGRKIGETVLPPAGFPQDGKWGLVKLTDSAGKERPCMVHQLPEDGIAAFVESMSSCVEGAGLVKVVTWSSLMMCGPWRYGMA